MSPALLAGLLAAASLAPFLNKAISGDSIFYLRVARQILVSPLRPFDFTLVVDHAARGGWAVANNPPLVSGWYALLIAAGGEREWWLHLGALIFPALAAAGTARLARALWPDVSRGWAVAAGLLAVWMPGVFVNSTDLLYDAGFLAAWVWAAALHAEALAEGSRAKRLAAYGCVAAAGMIKSVAVLLPPILWFHAWLKHRSLRDEIMGTFIPAAVWLAWAGHTLSVYGQVQILKARAEVGSSLRLHKEVSFLCALGGATVFLPALFAAAARRSTRGWIALVAVYLAGDFLFNYLGWPWHRAALGGAMLAGGAAAVGLLASEFRSAWPARLGGRGDDAPTAWLAGWALLVLGSLAYIDRIFAVRYILPAFPPLALLALRRLQAAWPEHARKALALTLAGTLVTAGGVAVADALWANAYRTAVTTALPPAGLRPVYFTGHLGWQYYLEKSGATALESANRDIPAGGLLLVPRIPVPQPVNPAIARRARLLHVLEFPSDWPIRTCSPAAQAGFHLNLFGVLPWSFSRAPLERIGVYAIR